MAFDAGAIVGRMTLDASAFNNTAIQVKNNVRRMGQEMQELGKSVVSVSKNLQQTGASLSFFGAAITAPLILAFKSAEEYSKPVQREIEKLKNIFIGLRVSIAESLLPTMQRFGNILADLLNRWNSLSPALRESITNTALITGVILTLGGAILMVIAKIGILFGQMLRWGGILVQFAAVHPILTGIAAAIAGVIFLMVKYEEVGVKSLNAIEIAANMVAIGWNKVVVAILNVIKYGAYAAGQFKFADTIKKDIIAAENSIVNLQSNIERVFTTGQGVMGETIIKLKGWVNEIKTAFGDIGTVDIDVTKWDKAAQDFAEGWKDALHDIKIDLQDWGKTAKGIANEMSLYMQTTFSNIFQEGLKGNIRSGKELIVDFGNFVIKVLSDVLAKWLTTQIIMGLAKVGSSVNVAASGASSAATSTGSVSGMGSVGSIGGFQEGTERIPYTGIYKLHSGEMVTPRYDAQKHESTQLTIYNMITPEAIATAMSGKEGQGVVVNIVNTNSLRNGVIRREVNKR